MLIFSENFKQFVKFFNNSLKSRTLKLICSKIDRRAKILFNPMQNNIHPERQSKL